MIAEGCLSMSESWMMSASEVTVGQGARSLREEGRRQAFFFRTGWQSMSMLACFGMSEESVREEDERYVDAGVFSDYESMARGGVLHVVRTPEIAHRFRSQFLLRLVGGLLHHVLSDQSAGVVVRARYVPPQGTVLASLL